MKSFLITALLSMGVAHTGAFLEVWSVPYVEDHLTLRDVGRKIDKVTEWSKTNDALRDKREKAAEENYALYDSPEGKNRDAVVEAAYSQPVRRIDRGTMKTRSRTLR